MQSDQEISTPSGYVNENLQRKFDFPQNSILDEDKFPGAEERQNFTRKWWASLFEQTWLFTEQGGNVNQIKGIENDFWAAE